ncbi:DUF2812 domain-containing protein ['Paenibacillus yunnanensis' Narsing Rao et al. 2020]|uniref:DUF2812 domain-containing protein n=1 Tax=Paenibacillus tengchongensis TaxID=2608684 RepID=UPI00124CF323|nr:DUF2812 domain-containing protein [Paenibacillus tengchongensis]
MRYNCYKWFSLGEHEKEEAWLNAMAAKGMMLTGVAGFKFTFEDDNPGKYTYRLELLDYPPTHPECTAYIKFMEETGIEHVGSVRRWVYFRRPAREGAFELYSDLDSKMRHYKRITSISNTVTLLMLIGFLVSGISWSLHAADAGWSRELFSINDPYFWALFYAVMLLVIASIIYFNVFAVRRSLRRLKKERKLSE